MTPEQLKQIAEYMGYTDVAVEDGLLWADKDNDSHIYSPLTNPEQLLELIDKLKLDINRRAGLIWVKDSLSDEWSRAETLAEAVCKAVLEMIGEGE